jgi:hypothetical protein
MLRDGAGGWRNCQTGGAERHPGFRRSESGSAARKSHGVDTRRNTPVTIIEMAGLSLGVAAFSFGLGYLVRMILGVEI